MSVIRRTEAELRAQRARLIASTGMDEATLRAGLAAGPQPSETTPMTDTSTPCLFCKIAAGRAPAKVVYTWPDAVAFVPLHPVTEGHTLVIPRVHVANFATDPEVSAATMRRAAEAASGIRPDGPMNLITSWGAAATQFVFHLHLHLVPRADGDGLALPWYGRYMQRTTLEFDAAQARYLAQRLVAWADRAGSATREAP